MILVEEPLYYLQGSRFAIRTARALPRQSVGAGKFIQKRL